MFGKRQGKDTVFNAMTCAAALLTGFALLIWFDIADDSILQVLLWPHAKAAEAFYHIKMYYVSGIGYSVQSGIFAIGRDCLGVNFIVLMFTMLVCMFVQWFPGFKKAIWVLLSFLGAVITGVLVSCIRIIGSIPFLSQEKFSTMHTVIGICLYFIVLLGSYFAVKKILGVFRHEES